MNNDLKANLVQPSNVVVVPAYSANPQAPAYQPPLGAWKDGLFNCFSNLWPSCCCVTLGGYSGGCLPMYLAGQISTRLGWFQTRSIISTYAIAIIAFWIIAIIASVSGAAEGGVVFLLYIPYIFAFAFLIMLRYKFVNHFQIMESSFETFCAAFWCSACSLCQMARHMYGYTRQLDGDALEDGSMVYGVTQV